MREDLQKIGSSPACHAARQALASLRHPAAQTAARWQDRIDAFRGGYDGLIQWYDERYREAEGNGQPAPVRPPRILHRRRRESCNFLRTLCRELVNLDLCSVLVPRSLA